MSAYICDPAHFAALAAFAASGRDSNVIREWRADGEPIESARRVAIGLAKENIRSVNAHYPDAQTDGGLPGPIMPLDKLLQDTAKLAERFFFQAEKLSLVDILKMCQGLDYQSCETDDWRDTLAFRQLEWIRSEAIRRLPGYEAAPWDYDGNRHDLSGPTPILLSSLCKKRR